jgi:hypothetical protein
LAAPQLRDDLLYTMKFNGLQLEMSAADAVPQLIPLADEAEVACRPLGLLR